MNVELFYFVDEIVVISSNIPSKKKKNKNKRENKSKKEKVKRNTTVKADKKKDKKSKVEKKSVEKDKSTKFKFHQRLVNIFCCCFKTWGKQGFVVKSSR